MACSALRCGKHDVGLPAADQPPLTRESPGPFLVLRLFRVENQQGKKAENRSPQRPAKQGRVVVGQLVPWDLTPIGNERGELAAKNGPKAQQHQVVKTLRGITHIGRSLFIDNQNMVSPDLTSGYYGPALYKSVREFEYDLENRRH